MTYQPTTANRITCTYTNPQPNEVTLSYAPLLVDTLFTQAEREQQIKGAQSANLPFFSVEIVPDELGTDQKAMYLQGEMPKGAFTDPVAIKDFLVEQGFSAESIQVGKDGTLYAFHPKEHLPFMHWIVRQIIHFQAKGEWLVLNYYFSDYITA